MTDKRNNSFGRRLAVALTLGLLVAACRDEVTHMVGANAAASGDPSVAVRVSTLGAAVGEQVAVAIHAEGPEGHALHGLQGTLRFNHDRLSYVGQSLNDEHPVMVMVNDRAADQGSVRFITVNPNGLDADAAVLVFAVKDRDYVRGLSFEFEGAAAPQAEWSRAKIASEIQTADVATASVVRGMRRDDWVRKLSPSLTEVMATPGQFLLNLKYGDATRNGLVNVGDVAYLSDLSIGLDLLIDATPRDAVIAGNVAPLNGGVGGAIRPGIDPTPGAANPFGVINVSDVSAISDASVGFATAPVGALIPGRQAPATNVVVVNANITADAHWTRDNIYQVGDATTGSINVTNGATLTIDPGTRVEGWYGTGVFGSGGVGTGQGSLAIRRDGRLVADGTALEPIVFTCKLPPFAGPRGEAINTRWPGCWGGLSISGNATINADDATSSVSTAVAGRTAAGCISQQDESDATNIYGGCSDTDSSGVLRYVRSEYAGARFTTTKERNGITFNGVGSHTVVDFIQVYASLDDGTEFFGGTVNIKHVVNIGNEDDNVDWVLGWRGAGQFIIVQADSTNSDRCMEMDNNGIDVSASNPDASPRSSPTLYNITCVGKAAPIRYTAVAGLPATCLQQLGSTSQPAANCVNQTFLFRQNTAGTLRNIISYRYPTGVDFDGNFGTQPVGGLCTQINAGPPSGLSIRNMLIALGPTVSVPAGATGYISEAGDRDSGDPTPGGNLCGPYTHSGSNLEALYIADAANAITVFGNDDANGDFLVRPLDVVAPDFRPKPGSAPVTATAAANPGTINGFAFETANYIGAVPASNSNGTNIPWYSGWTRGWETATTK